MSHLRKCDVWIPHVGQWILQFGKDDMEDLHKTFEWLVGFYRQDEKASDTTLMAKFRTREKSFAEIDSSFMSAGLRV